MKNNSNVITIIPSDTEKQDICDNDIIRERKVSKTVRATWSNHAEFLLSCIGFSVGLGNIWRFPYVCYKNGGGAFLIPYFFMLIACGLPLYCMELCLGQFTGFGPPRAFKLCPLLKGIGWAQIVILFIISIFYNIIMAYALFYLIASFRSTLLWTSCDNSFNSPNCLAISSRIPTIPKNLSDLGTASDISLASINGTISHNNNNLMERMNNFLGNNFTYSTLNLTTTLSNSTLLSQKSSLITHKIVSPTDDFWHAYVLEIGKSPGLHDLGGMRWPLAGLLLLSWLFVFACIFKGIKSLGKVAYITTILPYLILLILFIRGVTLDGARNGILYFLTPQWDKLKDINVWSAAAGQAFFSAGIGWGCIISFASFGSYRNLCYRDAMFISFLDTFTSIFSGLVIFSVLGYMAKQLNIPIDQVTESGQGLAFIVYPEAISTLKIPQLWNVLFFLMLYDLGLNSEFAMMETFISGLQDALPNVFPARRGIWNRLLFCLLCFLLGLPFVTRGGQYLISLVDHYCSNYSLVAIGACEIVGIMWIYGIRRFVKNIESMFKSKLPLRWFWYVSWCILCPLALWIIFIYSIVRQERLTLKNYIFPAWSNGIGALICIATIGQIPLFALYAIWKEKKTITRIMQSNSFNSQDKPQDSQVFSNDQIDSLKPRHLSLKMSTQLKELKISPGFSNVIQTYSKALAETLKPSEEFSQHLKQRALKYEIKDDTQSELSEILDEKLEQNSNNHKNNLPSTNPLTILWQKYFIKSKSQGQFDTNNFGNIDPSNMKKILSTSRM